MIRESDSFSEGMRRSPLFEGNRGVLIYFFLVVLLAGQLDIKNNN